MGAVMRNLIVEFFEDESGATTTEHGFVTIFLPIFIILILVATSLSMVTGMTLLQAPEAIAKALSTSFFGQ